MDLMQLVRRIGANAAAAAVGDCRSSSTAADSTRGADQFLENPLVLPAVP